MAAPLGADELTLRMRAGQPLPAILGLFESDRAHAACRAIIARGGDAFAPSMGDIEALGGTHKIRDLRVVEAGLEVDVWRGHAATIRPGDLFLAVRARLSSARREGPRPPPQGPTGGLLRAGSIAAGYLAFGWAGAYGVAAAFGGGYRSSEPISPRLAEKLDVHTRSGVVFQIDGDKFGFGALGELRGDSDNQNVDRMCELLTHLNRVLIVDPYFPLWRPPPASHRIRLPNMVVNNDDPAFAFYSRWAALLYRHVVHGAATLPEL